LQEKYNSGMHKLTKETESKLKEMQELANAKVEEAEKKQHIAEAKLNEKLEAERKEKERIALIEERKRKALEAKRLEEERIAAEKAAELKRLQDMAD